MTSKGYTTRAKIEDYILADIDPRLYTSLDQWIEGVEKLIDQITGRNFIAPSTASARYFDGNGDQVLLIDDAVAVTKVEVGNDDYGGTFTEIIATGSDRYFLEPANYGDKGVPVNSIMLNGRRWPEGKQNNKVTAKWGYSVAVPSDISFAATVFVAGIINQQRQGGDKIKSEKIGNYQVTYDENGGDSWADFNQAMAILDSYKKINI